MALYVEFCQEPRAEMGAREAPLVPIHGVLSGRRAISPAPSWLKPDQAIFFEVLDELQGTRIAQLQQRCLDVF